MEGEKSIKNSLMYNDFNKQVFYFAARTTVFMKKFKIYKYIFMLMS